jgi:hypothetical protein
MPQLNLVSPFHYLASPNIKTAPRITDHCEQVLWWAKSRLNDEVEREEEREGKWAVSLQPALTQEPRKFVR